MLKLQIRQQEMEISQDVRDLGEFFTAPAMKTSIMTYVANHPDTTFKAGLIAFSLITRLVQGKKRRTSRRK